jgi:hypothetical protein
MAAALLSPRIESLQGRGVQRDHSFGGELAERDLEPGPGRAVVHDRAQFQVEQLPDAQAGAAQDLQPGGDERIRCGRDDRHQGAVDVWCEGTRERLVEFGDVRGEQQPAGRGVVPVPGSDVVEQIPDAQHCGLHHGG